MSLRKIFYSLSPNLRLLARKILYRPLDLFSSRSYANGIPLPPKSLIFTGGGDFKETGFRFLSYFKKYGDLHPTFNVLDIGSGMGRMAIPLSHYMSNSGSYDGIDIMKEGTKWCSKNISTKFPNFKFHHVDLKNDLYKLDGGDASNFKLPFPSHQFDLVILISVFTHMLPEEVSNYFREIKRTLRSGKKCLITLFIFHDDTILVKNNFGKFIKQNDDFALMNEKVKSANVAYSMDFIKKQLKENACQLDYYSAGKWQDVTAEEDFQDFIVFSKL